MTIELPSKPSSMTMPSMRRLRRGSNPMMRVTLATEERPNPLMSPSTKSHVPLDEPTAPTPSTSGISSVFSRCRQSSIEKKPPSLRRTSSAPIKAPRFVSKMAPMLKRVVSGGKSRGSGEDNQSDGEEEDPRESLLRLLQVPATQRHSEVPLMAISHMDDC
ncbi:hypothetical protein ATCC90586_007864 [Pythium insidiosum]|nr:hypothetical protein ATCC90586_007864 [Pythium insidiosum]